MEGAEYIFCIRTINGISMIYVTHNCFTFSGTPDAGSWSIIELVVSLYVFIAVLTLRLWNSYCNSRCLSTFDRTGLMYAGKPVNLKFVLYVYGGISVCSKFRNIVLVYIFTLI